ncbi:hypothetical protein B0O99DRAFT_273458 [Bisporella sp. PMI_857]|nr:hypothetical protein B0O99DRAFT_273458 [Bisporella sp. PMI_857]
MAPSQVGGLTVQESEEVLSEHERYNVGNSAYPSIVVLMNGDCGTGSSIIARNLSNFLGATCRLIEATDIDKLAKDIEPTVYGMRRNNATQNLRNTVLDGLRGIKDRPPSRYRSPTTPIIIVDRLFKDEEPNQQNERRFREYLGLARDREAPFVYLCITCDPKVVERRRGTVSTLNIGGTDMLFGHTGYDWGSQKIYYSVIDNSNTDLRTSVMTCLHTLDSVLREVIPGFVPQQKRSGTIRRPPVDAAASSSSASVTDFTPRASDFASLADYASPDYVASISADDRISQLTRRGRASGGGGSGLGNNFGTLQISQAGPSGSPSRPGGVDNLGAGAGDSGNAEVSFQGLRFCDVLKLFTF